MSIQQKKQELRARYTDLRKRVLSDAAEAHSLSIARNIFSVVCARDADLVLAYCKIGAEVDSVIFMDFILRSGRALALPFCDRDGGLGIGRIFSPRDDLIRGAHNTLEPVDRLKGNIFPSQLEVVVCPGVAFDTTCARLGRGGGYYDKFLREVKGRAFIIGCAYDCQVSETPLPCEEHDVKMDAVITEKRTIYADPQSVPALDLEPA